MASMPRPAPNPSLQSGSLDFLDSPRTRHDLEALAEEIRRFYFEGQPSLPIRWGHRIQRRQRRSIRLGSYNHRTAEIRIHPLLDSPVVPAFFVQSVIHHEYLHHLLGARHDRRFHAHERRFRYHRESKEWIRRNLGLLLGRKLKPRRQPADAEPLRTRVVMQQLSLF
jgi:hypothetical protein